ncbi:hypothetical protein BDV96DRAFT_593855 [Lophiotrema nucula]|uniref:Uncharacterized protein n=1 Tax=Lophiotrema nucula TaxID=690887 RepID=A0A6A5ZR06_9PLEO|nr:hypothetical protein BDV96DRAFT_593855 [Lophiotrema nucula]
MVRLRSSSGFGAEEGTLSAKQGSSRPLRVSQPCQHAHPPSRSAPVETCPTPDVAERARRDAKSSHRSESAAPQPAPRKASLKEAIAHAAATAGAVLLAEVAAGSSLSFRTTSMQRPQARRASQFAIDGNPREPASPADPVPGRLRSSLIRPCQPSGPVYTVPTGSSGCAQLTLPVRRRAPPSNSVVMLAGVPLRLLDSTPSSNWGRLPSKRSAAAALDRTRILPTASALEQASGSPPKPTRLVPRSSFTEPVERHVSGGESVFGPCLKHVYVSAQRHHGQTVYQDSRFDPGRMVIETKWIRSSRACSTGSAYGSERTFCGKRLASHGSTLSIKTPEPTAVSVLHKSMPVCAWSVRALVSRLSSDSPPYPNISNMPDYYAFPRLISVIIPDALVDTSAAELLSSLRHLTIAMDA